MLLFTQASRSTLTGSKPSTLNQVSISIHHIISELSRSLSGSSLKSFFFFDANLCLESEKTSPEAYKEAWEILKRANGILVPGAFGSRGVEGKILAAKYARENKIPYFGICLGLQVS